jgi:hypothetical protein
MYGMCGQAEGGNNRSVVDSFEIWDNASSYVERSKDNGRTTTGL